jgi:hypothetical protein
MGVLRPLISQSQSVNKEAGHQPSDTWLTPANAMTASRPILGGIAARMLVRGTPGASLVAAGAAATDMEGLVARAIDKKLPNSGRGTSTKGKLGDPIADSMMLFELGAGALAGRKVSPLGKIAIAIVGMQEALKAKQALAKDREYRTLTGESLNVPISFKGKEAMAEKMVASGLAIATHEISNPTGELALGIGAIGFAVAGAVRGHSAHRENMQIANELITNAQIADASNIQ